MTERVGACTKQHLLNPNSQKLPSMMCERKFGSSKVNVDRNVVIRKHTPLR